MERHGVTCTRNYRVVGLIKHDDRFTTQHRPCEPTAGEVAIWAGPPYDSHLTVRELVDPDELCDGGIHEYYEEAERKILRKGLTSEGKDKDPATGRERRRPKLQRRAVEETAQPAGEQDCRLCRERKPLADFSRYAKSKTGFRNYCKECARDAAKKYLEAKGATTGSKK